MNVALSPVRGHGKYYRSYGAALGIALALFLLACSTAQASWNDWCASVLFGMPHVEEDSTRKQARLPHAPPSTTNTRTRAAQDSIRAAQQKTFFSGQVVITGARNEVLQHNSPVRVEVINRKQITSTGMVNLGNLLQEQTGMVLTTNVRSGVQMMGLNPDYTLILIDGQPMIGRVAGVLDLNRVSVGNVEHVEIVKGPMSSLYGSEALAGVINIITRKPQEGLNVRAYSQLISRGPSELQAELTYGGDRVDIALFGNYKNSLPFSRSQSFEQPSGRVDTLTTPFSGFTDMTAQGRIKWYAADNLTIGANVRYFNTRSEGSFIESFFGQIASNKGSVNQHDLSATLSAEYTMNKARLSLQSYASVYDETYNFDVAQGSAGRTDNLVRRISRTVLQYDLLWNLKNRFTFGGELQLDDASGSRYPDQPSYRTGVLFAQWEGNPTAGNERDWISYALSGRFDATNAFGSSFNPRLSVLLKPTDDVQIRLSGGTGFKAPDFRQLFVEFSNRLPGANYDLIGAYRLGNTLEPERSVAFDAGVNLNLSNMLFSGNEAAFWGIWALDVRGFRNTLNNLIEFFYVGQNGDRAVYSYRNLARAYTQGVEANVRGLYHLTPFDHLSISAGYQYLEAMDMEVLEAIERGEAGTVDPQTGAFQRLTRQRYGGLWFRSPHTGTVRVQYDNDELGITANIRAQYIGAFGDEALDKNGQAISNPPRKVADRDDEFAPSYVNINCTLSKTFTITQRTSSIIPALVRLNVGVNNLLDVINLRSLPGMVGRQVFVNVNVEW